MYSGHSASSSQLQEEYLLGKRRLDQRTTEVRRTAHVGR